MSALAWIFIWGLIHGVDLVFFSAMFLSFGAFNALIMGCISIYFEKR
jgi:hypothetical protein